MNRKRFLASGNRLWQRLICNNLKPVEGVLRSTGVRVTSGRPAT
ncbi:hypothetical protein C7S17_4743 [Burkholderia thailandensis]|nr:hypothetical protein [Burkholderia thailandensis]